MSVEVRTGMTGRRVVVEVGVCSDCRQRPPAKGEVLCARCLSPDPEMRAVGQHDGWTFTARDREVMAATRRWVEHETPVTSPAEAYASLLQRRQCP